MSTLIETPSGSRIDSRVVGPPRLSDTYLCKFSYFCQSEIDVVARGFHRVELRFSPGEPGTEEGIPFPSYFSHEPKGQERFTTDPPGEDRRGGSCDSPSRTDLTDTCRSSVLFPSFTSC